MSDVVLVINDSAHELARVGVLKTAVSDLGHAAEQLQYLADAAWPVGESRIEDAQAAVRHVRESLAAIDELGWPDTKGTEVTDQGS